MISSNEFKNGATIEIDGNVYMVVEFLHVKPGKGAAFVRTKLKNLKTGGVIEKTFRAGEKVTRAHVERKTMQYLYEADGLYCFMDNETYEQTMLPQELLEDGLKWLAENMEVTVISFGGSPIGVEMPNFVELEIIESEPGVKGDTSTGATKPAKVSTGAIVNVPLFVNEGEVIRIDTRTGEYLTRV